jgi:hypothetical protein
MVILLTLLLLLRLFLCSRLLLRTWSSIVAGFLKEQYALLNGASILLTLLLLLRPY